MGIGFIWAEMSIKLLFLDIIEELFCLCVLRKNQVILLVYFLIYWIVLLTWSVTFDSFGCSKSSKLLCFVLNLTTGVHFKGSGKRCARTGDRIGERSIHTLKSRTWTEAPDFLCFVLQRELLKNAEKLFQLVGGSASECGEQKKC